MAYQKEMANVEFDRWSASYDRSILQNWLFHPSHETLIAQIEPSDTRLLDVGCGTGQFLVEVLRRNPQLTAVGLDLSMKMLEQGSARFQAFADRMQAVRGDSEHLPFADDQFDVITCSHSFHHYPRQSAVVAEMHRVLKPNGKLLVLDGLRDTWWGWFIFDIMVTWAEGGVHHCSSARMRQLYRNSGFNDLKQLKKKWFVPYLLTVGSAHKMAKAQPKPNLAKAA